VVQRNEFATADRARYSRGSSPEPRAARTWRSREGGDAVSGMSGRSEPRDFRRCDPDRHRV